MVLLLYEENRFYLCCRKFKILLKEILELEFIVHTTLLKYPCSSVHFSQYSCTFTRINALKKLFVSRNNMSRSEVSRSETKWVVQILHSIDFFWLNSRSSHLKGILLYENLIKYCHPLQYGPSVTQRQELSLYDLLNICFKLYLAWGGFYRGLCTFPALPWLIVIHIYILKLQKV